MKSMFTIAVSAAALAVTLAAPLDARTRHHHHHHHHAVAASGGMKLMASLDGASETPAGDADGTGRFSATVNPGTGRICYTLTSAKIAAATMAHIHKGAAGASGPPVVTLKANAPALTCLNADKAVAADIAHNPDGYYVNVHTGDFPGGAIRGQLMAGDM